MNDIYKNVHFRIEVGYKWGEGYTNEKSDSFKQEIERIFTGLGFEIQGAKFSSSCQRVLRGNENLYCHPMDLSGTVYEESIAEIEEALKNSNLIKFRFTDVYDDVFDYNEEQVIEELEKEHKEKTIEMILNACKTTRKTKFVSLNIPRSPIKTVDKDTGEAAYRKFFEGLMNDLVDQGLLLKMNSESEYFRALNKTEMKSWEKKNGKLNVEIA